MTKLEYRTIWSFSLFLSSCNRPTTLYKDQAQVANYSNVKLGSGVEKTSGPIEMYVDSSKTIATPYNQGNEPVCGQNTG